MKRHVAIACFACFACALWTSTGAARGKVGLATMDLKPQGVEPALARNLTDLLTEKVRELGMFQVTSTDDIRDMIKFQEDRRLSGCESDVACLVEIGGALGVEYMIAGTVGKLGETYLLHLRLIHITKAKVLGSASLDTETLGAEVIDKLARAVRQLTRTLRRGKSGFLSVHANEEGARVMLDGKLVGTTPLPLMKVSGGMHDVELVKDGFVTWANEVELTPGEQATVNAILVPSAKFRDEFASRERTRRYFAWGLLGLGVASAAGSAAFYVLAADKADESRTKTSELEARPNDTALRNEISEVNDAGRTQYVLYWVLMGSTVAASAGSLYLLLTGEDPARYEMFDAGDGKEPGGDEAGKSADEPSAELLPILVPGGGGLGFGARF